MSTPAQKLRTYGRRMPLLLIFLALPWLWAALIVPWWVSVVGLILLPVAAAMIVVAVFPTPPASRRATDDIQLSDAQIEKMREASSGLHNLLERWSTLSRSTGVNLESARQRLGFALQTVDVDTSADLAARYGECVPVVTVDGKIRFTGEVNPVLLDRLLHAKARQAPERGA